jgi:FkbH-like protein
MSEDLGDYLSSLEMEIKFASFDNRSRQRITQLINKTNQFNLTTKRYTEQTVAEIEEDKSLFSLQVRLADKFGDLGMIGVVICRPGEGDAATWNIDTWLMSCRVLGRRVEQAMLSKIASEGRARGVSRLVGLYVPTNKNNMVADHYEKLGFRLLERDSSGRSTWECDVLSYSAPEIPMTIIDGFLLG